MRVEQVRAEAQLMHTRYLRNGPHGNNCNFIHQPNTFPELSSLLLLFLLLLRFKQTSQKLQYIQQKGARRFPECSLLIRLRSKQT